VVATHHGSVPEIVVDGVTGFVRATETDLADVLRHVDEIDRGVCRKSVEERFSLERMVEDHVALYTRVRSARRGPLRVA
jgi:glycosyltransferase involved in cell wall biosynthesis